MLLGQLSAWKISVVCACTFLFALYFLHGSEVPEIASNLLSTQTSKQDIEEVFTSAASDQIGDITITSSEEAEIVSAEDTVITQPVSTPISHSQKPSQRIVGLVFAGRQAYVSILDCYLQRNLVRNGGWLDEVLWLIATPSSSDEAYLKELVASVPEYTSHHASEFEPDGKKNYAARYQYCERDTIYIKIDDDVVFFEDDTIAKVVQRLIDSPQYLAVSANVMNQPAMSFIHYHLDTALPYLPELTDASADALAEMPSEQALLESLDWRPSKLPQWEGPAKFHFTEMDAAPFKNHRWLLAKGFDLELTPLGALGRNAHHEYVANSTGWHSWAIAAQEHYSFLTHLENNELYRYKFDLWNMHYDRLSINFLAFRGDDVNDYPVSGSDEAYLTVSLPLKLRRPVVLEGSSLANHFGFHRQAYGHGGIRGKALNDTDLVLRYKKYAEEFVCNKPWGSSMYPL